MPSEDALLNPKFPYFMIGVIFLAAAVVSTCAGKTFSGYGGWASRVKEPTQFWWSLAILYLSAIFFIGAYLYGVYKFPN
jgi:ABC-type cobalamin transport system permease subunit